MMNRALITRVFSLRLCAAALSLCTFLATVSCDSSTEVAATVEVDQAKLDAMEQLALDSWVEKNYPDGEMSRQSEGYYSSSVTSLDSGSTRGDTAEATYTHTTLPAWIKYNIVASDLDGNISYTRDESVAYAQGTFSHYTHYGATMLYLGESANSGNHLDLLLRNSDIELRIGDQISAIAPSKLVSVANGYGGYAGQFTAASNIPIFSTLEITEIITDMAEHQTELINTFVTNNSKLGDWSEPYNPDLSEDTRYDETYTTDLYYTMSYNPKSDALVFSDPYTSSVVDYDAINTKVDAILAELFIDIGDFNISTSDDNILGRYNYANVWYITRLLNGFIVDTNIDAIRELVFKDYAGSNTEALEYQATFEGENYIYSWYHTIPMLKYGSCSVMVTHSDYAYGSSGSAGSSTSTEIQAYTPLIFQLFIEPDGYNLDSDDDEDDDDDE